MRYTIFNPEGPQPQKVKHGALEWDGGERMPVFYMGGRDLDSLSGYAHKLELEEDGSITAEIEWLESSISPQKEFYEQRKALNEEFLKSGMADFSVYVTNMTIEDDIVVDGLIHSVWLMLIATKLVGEL